MWIMELIASRGLAVFFCCGVQMTSGVVCRLGRQKVQMTSGVVCRLGPQKGANDPRGHLCSKNV